MLMVESSDETARKLDTSLVSVHIKCQHVKLLEVGPTNHGHHGFHA